MAIEEILSLRARRYENARCTQVQKGVMEEDIAKMGKEELTLREGVAHCSAMCALVERPHPSFRVVVSRDT